MVNTCPRGTYPVTASDNQSLLDAANRVGHNTGVERLPVALLELSGGAGEMDLITSGLVRVAMLLVRFLDQGRVESTNNDGRGLVVRKTVGVDFRLDTSYALDILGKVVDGDVDGLGVARVVENRQSR